MKMRWLLGLRPGPYRGFAALPQIPELDLVGGVRKERQGKEREGKGKGAGR